MDEIWKDFAGVFPSQETLGAKLDIIKEEYQIAEFLLELHLSSSDTARNIDSYIGKRGVVLSPNQMEKGSKLFDLVNFARTNFLEK